MLIRDASPIKIIFHFKYYNWKKGKRGRERDDESLSHTRFRGEPFLAISSRSSRVRETMRAKRVKQAVDVGEERRPPEDTIARETRGGRKRRGIRYLCSHVITPDTAAAAGSGQNLVPVAGASSRYPLPSSRPPEIPLSLSVIYGS